MKKLNILKAPEFGVSIALIGLFILMSFLSPLFLSGYNLINILLQSSTYIILSIGMTFVIVTGGIDLSVGSIAVVSGILMASLMKSGTNVFIAILAGLIISILCGFINGFLVSKINLPSFIVTLATMSIFQGAALIFSGGLPIYGFPKSFSFLGIGSILSIPIPVIIALICIIISIFIFKKTKIGHYALAIGDNRQAVKMCGINIFKYEMIVYMINGFTTGIAAIITTARLNSAEPLGSMSMGLDAVAAVVMSGTSLSGGTGSVTGAIIGSLLMGVLRNGMTLLNVQSYYQNLIIGIVILIAVFIDKIRNDYSYKG
ncbi:ABC transporter permease [Oceanotoga sp. DSM 15011]|jgi:ribose transport system permease protein|uniref:Monosaccharide ABC transporter membrane protein (CUT2 family) n=1 Tax=Oceanotoga teriensis TaxID=515440 RepID=A0AA45C5I1_9BACT|nr:MULTISPECIES: ABC transporter permease [Oceanotoga]PWJ89022.1 monosaccharide ABC transporter membrane protein (CUT2 family) [Oceanotoga teriensis]UYP01386.1 ABC transporter permease [Oceanotoga sp. DSM 15011]